jgi:Family of unknown function (DUF5565)
VTPQLKKDTMKKTLSLFERNYDGDRLVRDEIVPGAEWVVAGEGVATRKHDGTCCMVRGGKLYKRYDAKSGTMPPSGFEPAQPEPDAKTGHWPGWMAVEDGPEDMRHREGLAHYLGYAPIEDGTYELCGPKVQGNPERKSVHMLIRHGCEVLGDAPRTYDALASYLAANDIEGIVWHHPDGRMVKIKGKDFGLKRG